MEIRPIDANALTFKEGVLCDDQGFSIGHVSLRKSDIDAAPTLDYAPVRHGEWKRTVVARHGEMHTLYACSECNDYHGFREDPGQHTFCSNYLYCRTCGAKMDGGKKDG